MSDAASLLESPRDGFGLDAVLRADLPEIAAVDRLLLRTIGTLSVRQVLAVEGVEHIMPARDPFILALNHSTRCEALLVPALLMLLRGGRRIHMLADWNFKLVPFVATIYRRAGVITVDQKRARPRWLEVFKPWLTDRIPANERARDHLRAGRSIGLFPEGTVNRDPHYLRRGRTGAARLALDTSADIVPVGLRFPDVPVGSRIPEHARMSVHIGAPVTAIPGEVEATHASVMRAIADLSAKSWPPRR